LSHRPPVALDISSHGILSSGLKEQRLLVLEVEIRERLHGGAASSGWDKKALRTVGESGSLNWVWGWNEIFKLSLAHIHATHGLIQGSNLVDWNYLLLLFNILNVSALIFR
jgi:hypothetical protein